MLPTSNIRLPGGRSRRPYRGMATIRDKLGHWSSADPGHGGQDQFALTSERHLNGSHSGEPRSPGIGHETGPSALSTASPPHDRASREANRVRDRRRRAKPIPVVSRGGEGGIGSVLALRRRPDRCLARRWGVGRSQRMAQFAANRCHTPCRSRRWEAGGPELTGRTGRAGGRIGRSLRRRPGPSRTG